MNLIEEVKKKKEFSELPDSVVERALGISKGDVKESRALLRKYFGVFLTNKVLKGKGDLLEIHMSSKKRDYEKFYGEIFDEIGEVGSVIDLGCGVNGLSYIYLKKELGDINYLGIEAAGQLVDHMNNYFRDRGFEKAHALTKDLFQVKKIVGFLKQFETVKPRIVFMFQVVDALENLEKNFSKEFILEISKESEKIVLSLPTESLGGRKKFAARRNWIVNWLEENFVIEKDFNMSGERVIIFHK